MSAPQPCVPCCATTVTVNTPGPEGLDGTNGTNGVNAFTLVTGGGFVIPAVGSTVTAPVANSASFVIGQYVIAGVSGTGLGVGPANFIVTAVPSSTGLTLEFLGNPGDQSPGVTITAGSQITPAGERGGSTLAVRNTAISTSATAFDDVIIVTADNKTITLPTAVGITGKVYTVIQTAAFTSGTTIATTGGQNINGSATATLGAQYKYKAVVSDGANWFIIANN